MGERECGLEIVFVCEWVRERERECVSGRMIV